MRWMLDFLKLSQRLFKLSSCFGFFFLLLVLIDWYFCFLMFQILDLVLSCFYWFFVLLLFLCKLIFISIRVPFISDWTFFMLLRSSSLSSLSNPITSVLNSASDRLLISISLAFFLKSCSVLSFGPCFFVSSFWQPPCFCFYVLGRAALTLCLGSMT